MGMAANPLSLMVLLKAGSERSFEKVRSDGLTHLPQTRMGSLAYRVRILVSGFCVSEESEMVGFCREMPLRGLLVPVSGGNYLMIQANGELIRRNRVVIRSNRAMIRRNRVMIRSNRAVIRRNRAMIW